MRGTCYGLLIGALAVAAFWAGTRADLVMGVSSSVAYADRHETPRVTDRQSTVNGVTVGEVLINDAAVIRMRTSAGGFTAHERARIIAGRLQQWLAGPHSPDDISAREGRFGGAELRAAGRLIAHVNEAEAAEIGSTAMGLATAWHSNILSAMGVEPAVPVMADQPTGDPGTVTEVDPEQIEEVAAEPPQPEGYSDKIVPIFSLGRGARIGAARVNGPSDAVARVQGVTQLETRFRNFLVIDIYVPVTTEGGLDRVQRVGLTAIGDIGL